MKLEEISEKQYKEFWEQSSLKSFLSAPYIAKLREKEGWKHYFVGLVSKNAKLVGASLLVAHKRHFGKWEFYAPRGFLIDFNNEDILREFTQRIKQFVQKEGGYVLRIDPYLINKERDIDGNIVSGGIDNSSVITNLLKLGYKRVNVTKMEQVGWMFSLNLDGKTEEQILKEMKPNTRNTIHKAEKLGITVKELSYDELPRFQNIMIETGARKEFAVRNIEYYQEMYKLLHDSNEVKYYVTELNLKEYLERLLKEKDEREKRLANLSTAKYNDNERNNLTKEVASYVKRIEDAKNIQKEKKSDVITLSGSMFIMIKPEIIYLSSGNYSEFMKFNSQYLLQWLMIKYGLKNGFKKHNFYGIPANINTHPKDYGIYEFKRGFNGYVEELIGEYELPITKEYYLFKLIHKIKK